MEGFARDRVSCLALGTASLGMAYGVANPDIALGRREAHAILGTAWKAGITCIDTAPAYGQAEAYTGEWVASSGADPLIVTKLPSLGAVPDSEVAGAARHAIEASLARLGRDKLDGYLAHGGADYARPAVRDALEALRSDGLIAAFGASVYDPRQALSVLETGPPDLLQLPLNLLDRRMVDVGVLAACRDAGVMVFARSIFLQGAMLMAPEALPRHLAPMARTLADLRELARTSGTTVQSLAVRWVRNRPAVTSCVVGVYSPGQLHELVDAAS